jgi:hypothetical protein
MLEPPKDQSCATCLFWIQTGTAGECRQAVPMWRRGDSGRFALSVPVCPPEFWCGQWKKG